MRWLPVWTVYMVFFVACSENEDTVSESDTDDDSDSDSLPDDTYVGGCPGVLPEDGSMCNVLGTVCTYGGSPVVACRDEATCYEGEWYVSPARCDFATEPCREDLTAGDDCVTPDARCLYEPGTECVCLSALGNKWGCEPPPTPAQGCPAYPPNQGTACAKDAPDDCAYERCMLADEIVTLNCQEGMWTWVMENCGEDHNR